MADGAGKRALGGAKPPRPIARLRVGPGGLIYLVVTGLIVAAAVYTQANLLFWAFGLMVGGFLASAALAWLSLRGLQVQRLVPGHGVCGEPLVLRYRVRNHSRLPAFSMMIHETWGRGLRGWKRTGPAGTEPRRLKGRPVGWLLHVGRHQAMQAEAVCWPLRRGPLAFERVVVSTSFPFGIVRKIVEFPLPGHVLIYPHLFRLNRRFLFSLSSLDPSGKKQVDRGGGTEEFFGIRPYRLGDSLKHIDWKRTAHSGELVARELTQPSPPRMMVLLDLTSTSGRSSRAVILRGGRGAPAQPAPPRGAVELLHMSHEEKAIALTASLVVDAHLYGYQIGLAIAGVEGPVFPVHHSLPHRTKMLEALAALDLTKRVAKPLNPAERPSVIIWPGAGEAARARGGGQARAAMIGAADLERYIADDARGSDVLRARSRPGTRREEIDDDAKARRALPGAA